MDTVGNRIGQVHFSGRLLARTLAGSFLEKTLLGQKRDPAKIGAKE